MEEYKIAFVEIKTYDEAYYYNTDPSERNLNYKREVKIENKKGNFSGKLLEVIGEVAEGILELIFSFLD